ncbi:DNA polymerase/3'-5' exonuclease PolX [Methanofollis fontis]|uniref:DNA polymerase beta n=1 Tax=Methanofollis fontis TaxID=2052832 RepID=A0A483CR31_9EURY|nr:DNA polymerase/3'-5' exonuclease PolX [Methanofollis fontis]TAJ43400.1 histidinol-phosphatase [Methanofollis fontis]
MEMTNRQVARVLEEIGQLLEVQGENRFKVRAYMAAADRIGHLTGPVGDLTEEELEAIPGIGRALAGKIHQIVQTGTCTERERLIDATPPGLIPLLDLPGVGPKTVRRLWTELGVEDTDSLIAAARNRRVRALKGFGAKKESDILRAAETAGKMTERMDVSGAKRRAAVLMAAIPGEAWVAGSLRRGRSTIGDIDIVTTAPPGETNRALRRIADSMIDEGERKTSVRIEGRRADIRYADTAELGTMLLYLTGSKAFNIRLRGIAAEQGMRLNEYGLLMRESGEVRTFPTEEGVFGALGMVPVPPELREDRGEVEYALEGRLPDLVDAGAIRGDLHVHSEWSDGTLSLPDIADEGEKKGYEYILITDHAAGIGVTHGLDAARLERQRHEIERVNRNAACTLLAGIEVDILADGHLSLPDTALKACDLVVASVHTAFGQDADTMTRRMIVAIENEHVDIIGHPTARLIGRRPPTAVDMDRIIDAAAATGTALEINASPARLDLDDIYIRQAKEQGVNLSIGTDAHRRSDLEAMRYGVALARRGWCGPSDILNTRPLSALLRADE